MQVKKGRGEREGGERRDRERGKEEETRVEQEGRTTRQRYVNNKRRQERLVMSMRRGQAAGGSQWAGAGWGQRYQCSSRTFFS